MGVLHSERRERREMYHLLILLVSPAFGRPSSDQDAEENIENQLDHMLLFTNETGKFLLNSSLTEEVIRVLQEAEQNILKMNAKLKTFETKEIRFNDTYFPKFNQAKSYLKQSKRDLRKLADRTVTDVRDLKIFLGALDETKDSSNVNPFLEIFLNRMKDLMIETLKTLKNAKRKYNSALDTFDNLKYQIESENLTLKKMLDKDSEEYKAWKENVENAIEKPWLTWTTATSGGCLISFSLPLLLLLCAPIWVFNGVALAGTHATRLAAAEAAVARTAADLKKISDRMLESGDNFEQALNVAIENFQNEIEIIGKWTQSAKIVRDNIDEYPVEILSMIKSIRTIFVTGLDNLKKAAEDFLAEERIF